MLESVTARREFQLPDRVNYTKKNSRMIRPSTLIFAISFVCQHSGLNSRVASLSVFVWQEEKLSIFRV